VSLQFSAAQPEACVAAYGGCTSTMHLAPHETRRMSQTWKLIGPDGKPYASAVPGALGGHRRNRIYGRFDCPAALRCAPSLEVAMSPTGSSFSAKSTRGPPVTAPAPSAFHWSTHAGKRSRAADRRAGRFLREDGDRLYEPEKCDRWNDSMLATKHHLEGGTS
jgi:hypothetical protein